MTVEKPKPKQLLRPITPGTCSAMNQSQFLAITCNSLEARKKSRVHGAIGFGFDSHWLKNWRASFKQSQARNNFRQSFENCSIRVSNLRDQTNSSIGVNVVACQETEGKEEQLVAMALSIWKALRRT